MAQTRPGPSRGRSRGAGAGFAVAGAAGVVLSWSIATGDDILTARGVILARLAAWSVGWVVAVACAFRLPRRAALAVPGQMTITNKGGKSC